MVIYFFTALSLCAGDEIDAEDVLGFKSDDWEQCLHRFDVQNISGLALESGAEQVIRIYLAPSFENPCLYEGVKKDGRWALTSKILNGKGGHEWGKIKSTTTVELPAMEGDKFDLLSNDREIWRPLNAAEIGFMSTITDGERWKLEHWNADKSRTILLRSPECLLDKVSDGVVRDPKVYIELLRFMREHFISK